MKHCKEVGGLEKMMTKTGLMALPLAAIVFVSLCSPAYAANAVDCGGIRNLARTYCEMNRHCWDTMLDCLNTYCSAEQDAVDKCSQEQDRLNKEYMVCLLGEREVSDSPKCLEIVKRYHAKEAECTALVRKRWDCDKDYNQTCENRLTGEGFWINSTECFHTTLKNVDQLRDWFPQCFPYQFINLINIDCTLLDEPDKEP